MQAMPTPMLTVNLAAAIPPAMVMPLTAGMVLKTVVSLVTKAQPTPMLMASRVAAI